MGIMDDDIRRVREESDIIRLITQHTQLKKVGRSWKGLCPFHNEKTPSFTVNQETGRYYCFGCQAKGDIFTIYTDLYNYTFLDAVKELAQKAGVQINFDNEKN